MKKQFFSENFKHALTMTLITVFVLLFWVVLINLWIYAVKAELVATTVTVPVNYSCKVIGFDLHCRTNAQKVFVNEKIYDLSY